MCSSNWFALKERQQKSLQLCENKISQWTSFCKEYNDLKAKLVTITDKTRHLVMIPVVRSNRNRPPIALVPGVVQHTNEILVLLGDNWFAERSAKEAIDIVQRRLKSCKDMLSQLEQEKNKVLNWISFTDKLIEENNDFVEIIEEYDEEEELKWREEHKRKVTRFKQEESMQRMNENVDFENSSHIEGIESYFSDTLNEKANLVEKQSFPIKSILKNKSIEERMNIEKCSGLQSRDCEKSCGDVSTFSIAKLAVSDIDRQTNDPLTKDVQKPFTGEIVERIGCQTMSEQPKSSKPKIVSKFKKERKK